MVQFKKTSWAGLWQGAFYGFLIWVVWHLSLMPILGTTPAPWQMPFAEHFSEFFGHLIWGWSIAAVGYYMIAKQKVQTLTNQYW
ncbi:Putative uncharacterized protein [Lactobacillus hominis DSM 23910 = CRBIP 24.179]|uniref:Integral membrane protein n=1 Tax=Lactobacillus hominis DSM 23910 = CRBIP 24.179 TaxID=1423758 RepID=I7KG96_9LACO|nr:Putative uncharacterized protein [Lactobacillus hominis DSM 23910 = CRBIP 24.179]